MARKLLILFSLQLFIVLQVFAEPYATQKILSGTTVPNEKNIGVVRLIISTALDEYLCSGALITPNVVLTAAHCVQGRVTNISASIGFGRSTTAYRIKRLRGYSEDLSEEVIMNDLALVFLHKNLVKAQVPVLPIFKSAKLRRNSRVLIYGYGINEYSSDDELRTGSMRLLKTTKTHLFAKYRGRSSNPCFGDSGGPVIASARDKRGVTVTGIVGVISAGNGYECERGETNSFTSLQNPKVLRFIKNSVSGVSIR